MMHVMRWLGFLVVLSIGCGDDATTTPDGGARDGGRRDSGVRDAGGTRDAGSTDSGSTDSGATDAGSTDAGSTDAGSDAGFDADLDGGDACTPECEPDFVCSDDLRCVARCIFDGCVDPTDVCLEDEGCRPALCTEAECIGMPSLMHCDSTTGCYDPCAPERIGDFSACIAMGGRCGGGACVDDTCGGGTFTCGFRMDCCGNMICQDARDPDPPCPIVCDGVPVPAPRPSDCACGVGGFCVDQRFPS
jgi:hypothetical protein